MLGTSVLKDLSLLPVLLSATVLIFQVCQNLYKTLEKTETHPYDLNSKNLMKINLLMNRSVKLLRH